MPPRKTPAENSAGVLFFPYEYDVNQMLLCTAYASTYPLLLLQQLPLLSLQLHPLLPLLLLHALR